MYLISFWWETGKKNEQRFCWKGCFCWFAPLLVVIGWHVLLLPDRWSKIKTQTQNRTILVGDIEKSDSENDSAWTETYIVFFCLFYLLLLSTITSKRTMYPHLYVDNTPLYISDLSFCNNMFYMQYWCQQLLKGFSYTLILDLCVCRILSQPSPKALYWPSWSQESPTCLWHSRQVTQPCTTRSTRTDPV